MAYEIYVDNIDKDEMRSGFLVTTDRKKLWNVELNLIVEFARICKKHDLRWFVSGGTLLGAARHGGFIPWDDDVDIVMMRPDYEKFKSVAPSELKPEFFLDIWHNYVREGEPNPNNYQVIKREHLQKYPWLPFSPFLKIRDPRTTFVKYPEVDNLMQSIWLDVFPFDPVPPFDNPEHEKIFRAGEELRVAATYPEQIIKELELKREFINRDLLEEVVRKPFHERAVVYENYLATNYFESKYCCGITFNNLPLDFPNHAPPYTRYYYREAAYLPFERLTVPLPIDYVKVLRNRYGVDWMTPRRTHIHAKIFSTDVSYKDYFAQRED